MPQANESPDDSAAPPPPPRIDLMTLSSDVLYNLPVWRCISARFHYGHWEYLLDEPVTECNLQSYISDARKMGAERISLHYDGTLRESMSKTHEPMKGTTTLRKIQLNHALEDFMGAIIE